MYTLSILEFFSEKYSPGSVRIGETTILGFVEAHSELATRNELGCDDWRDATKPGRLMTTRSAIGCRKIYKSETADEI